MRTVIVTSAWLWHRPAGAQSAGAGPVTSTGATGPFRTAVCPRWQLVPLVPQPAPGPAQEPAARPKSPAAGVSLRSAA